MLGVTEIVPSSIPSLNDSIKGISNKVTASPAITAVRHMVMASNITEEKIVKSLCRDKNLPLKQTMNLEKLKKILK